MRCVIHGKDVSINNKLNKEDNTNVIDNKLNNGAKKTMVGVNTSITVLELSDSVTNTKDVSNNNNKNNSAKSKERDNTNSIEDKNNGGTKETMASTIALT